MTNEIFEFENHSATENNFQLKKTKRNFWQRKFKRTLDEKKNEFTKIQYFKTNHVIPLQDFKEVNRNMESKVKKYFRFEVSDYFESFTHISFSRKENTFISISDSLTNYISNLSIDSCLIKHCPKLKF